MTGFRFRFWLGVMIPLLLGVAGYGALCLWFFVHQHDSNMPICGARG